MSYVLYPSTQPPVQSPKRRARTKIALFDIDGTLILSKSGQRWAKSAADVFFLNDAVHALDARARDGWIVALVTNQSEWKRSPDIQQKIEHVLSVLDTVNGWRPWCVVATATIKERDTHYRKPGRGMYDVLLQALGLDAAAVTDLYMVGDAVGADDPYPPYRFSDSDAGFAAAIGAKFARASTLLTPTLPAPSTQRELVLLVGNPGSGKSSTSRRFAEAGYKHLEQDVLGSKQAVFRAAVDALRTGSIVVDATHSSSAARKPYYDLARTQGVPVRVLWHVRDGRPFNALRPKPVPEVAYAIYSKHFEAPWGDAVPVEIVI